MINIVIQPGSRADCPDGHMLQEMANQIAQSIEYMTGWPALYSGDIELEFSDIVKVSKSNAKRKKRQDYNNEIDKIRKMQDDIKEYRERPPQFDYVEECINRNYPIDVPEHIIEEELRHLLKIISGNSNVGYRQWAEDHAPTLITEIKSILASLASSTAYILGEYSHKLRKIVIYDESISLVHPHNYDDALKSTFAHEMFHAVHMDSIKGYDATKKKKEIVLESLASYYEFKYCENELHNSNLAYDLWYEWDSYDIFDWPYSGAIALEGLKHDPYKHRHHGKINLFIRAYFNSLKSIKLAYSNIISGYEAYEGRILKHGTRS